MMLVPAKCTNCGGNINIDPTKRGGICEYCKQPFVVEDAINNFNTTYNITNNNKYQVENAEIHINDDRGISQKIENAEVYFTKLNSYGEAERLFTEVSKEAPGRYEGWWGLVRVMTCNFSEYSNLLSAEKYLENALKFTKEADLKATIICTWNNYIDKYLNLIVMSFNANGDYLAGCGSENLNDDVLKKEMDRHSSRRDSLMLEEAAKTKEIDRLEIAKNAKIERASTRAVSASTLSSVLVCVCIFCGFGGCVAGCEGGGNGGTISLVSFLAIPVILIICAIIKNTSEIKANNLRHDDVQYRYGDNTCKLLDERMAIRRELSYEQAEISRIIQFITDISRIRAYKK